VPTGPEPRIRQLRQEEADEVGRLTLEAYDAYGTLTGPYRDRVGDPSSRVETSTAVLVAELADHVAGTVTFVLPADPDWEPRPEPAGDAGFRILAVAPWAEGRGVGRALVAACVERAHDAGARRIVITTMAWMTRAHELYRRLGFVHRPDLDLYFPSGLGHTYVLDLQPDAADHFAPPGPVPAEPPWFEDIWALR
jgi:predicted N-acetyltransferase YhbS